MANLRHWLTSGQWYRRCRFCCAIDRGRDTHMISHPKFVFHWIWEAGASKLSFPPGAALPHQQQRATQVAPRVYLRMNCKKGIMIFDLPDGRGSGIGRRCVVLTNYSAREVQSSFEPLFWHRTANLPLFMVTIGRFVRCQWYFLSIFLRMP
jgi:hypothetical protein